jgi:hypothetical protein
MNGLVETCADMCRRLASIENFKGGRHVLKRFAPSLATLQVYTIPARLSRRITSHGDLRAMVGRQLAYQLVTVIKPWRIFGDCIGLVQRAATQRSSCSPDTSPLSVGGPYKSSHRNGVIATLWRSAGLVAGDAFVG